MFVPSDEMTDEKAGKVLRDMLAQFIALENYFERTNPTLASDADALFSMTSGLANKVAPTGEPEPVAPF